MSKNIITKRNEISNLLNKKIELFFNSHHFNQRILKSEETIKTLLSLNNTIKAIKVECQKLFANSNQICQKCQLRHFDEMAHRPKTPISTHSKNMNKTYLKKNQIRSLTPIETKQYSIETNSNIDLHVIKRTKSPVKKNNSGILHKSPLPMRNRNYNIKFETYEIKNTKYIKEKREKNKERNNLKLFQYKSVPDKKLTRSLTPAPSLKRKRKKNQDKKIDRKNEINKQQNPHILRKNDKDKDKNKDKGKSVHKINYSMIAIESKNKTNSKTINKLEVNLRKSENVVLQRTLGKMKNENDCFENINNNKKDKYKIQQNKNIVNSKKIEIGQIKQNITQKLQKSKKANTIINQLNKEEKFHQIKEEDNQIDINKSLNEIEQDNSIIPQNSEHEHEQEDEQKQEHEQEQEQEYEQEQKQEYEQEQEQKQEHEQEHEQEQKQEYEQEHELILKSSPYYKALALALDSGFFPSHLQISLVLSSPSLIQDIPPIKLIQHKKNQISKILQKINNFILKHVSRYNFY